MSKIVVPELGGEFITDPETQISLLLSHALAADYSQSNIYAGTITSIPFIISQYQNNPGEMVEKLTQALDVYFLRYFDLSNTEITYDDTLEQGYNLAILINVTIDGVVVSMRNLGRVNDGILTDVIKEINR